MDALLRLRQCQRTLPSFNLRYKKPTLLSVQKPQYILVGPLCLEKPAAFLPPTTRQGFASTLRHFSSASTPRYASDNDPEDSGVPSAPAGSNAVDDADPNEDAELEDADTSEAVTGADRRGHENFVYSSSDGVVEDAEAEPRIGAGNFIIDSPANEALMHAGDRDYKPPGFVPDIVPAIPLLRKPYFPGTKYLFTFLDPKIGQSLKQRFNRNERHVGLFLIKDVGKENTMISSAHQLHTIGVLGYIEDINPFHLSASVGGAQLILHALERISWTEQTSADPLLMVKIHRMPNLGFDSSDTETRAYAWEIMDTVKEMIKYQPANRQEMEVAVNTIDRNQPDLIADLARLSNSDGRQLQSVLDAETTKERLQRTLHLFKSEFDLIRMQRQIEEKSWKNQRKHFLMEQLKSIRRELGLDVDEKENLIAKYKARLEHKAVPKDALKIIEEELSKLSSLEPISSEFNVSRTYLDILTQLPWGTYDKEKLSVSHATKVLDKDHYGLKDVKERILEFIAVGAMQHGPHKAGVQGKILCFVGPPGVGKTSIGKSIGRALGRKFYRFSVGGMSDVAEIKGHRRTYVGAMPGKLIQALKLTATSNPLIMIDEIDKLGRGYQGDPASALLEVLDPEQNNSFLDHYLDIPYDLSKVLFVCTANVTDTIPAPLLDRMEVIRLSGYVTQEKIAIAKRYLIPHAYKSSGLTRKQLLIGDGATKALIESYCREAGVRSLQQHIEKICRKAALKILKAVEGDISAPTKPEPNNDATATTHSPTPDPAIADAPSHAARSDLSSMEKAGREAALAKVEKVRISGDNLSEFVGQPPFSNDRLYEKTPPGVAVGLAWTSLGGATLFIESTSVAGTVTSAGLKTTGQMGSVMKESSDIAHTYARAFLRNLDPDNGLLENSSVHMHIPEGATPKDGPSAGITMVTSLLSLALGRPVRHNLAMTGEISLTGKVLAIGGVKEKTIAAKRVGVTRLIFPAANRKDFKELPDYITEGIQVNYVETYDEVFAIALPPSEDTPTPPLKPKRASSSTTTPTSPRRKPRSDKQPEPSPPPSRRESPTRPPSPQPALLLPSSSVS